jgi:hypothetical protein
MDFVSRNLLDPMRLAELLWPDDVFYKDQVDIIYSVKDNDETYVPAGNMLGKDYIAAFIAVWIFLSAIKTGHTCRIASTSVREKHLMVLWAEIAKRVMRSKYPLTHDKGGPLVLMNMEIRRTSERDQKNPDNYLIGMVSEKIEGSAGHHADINLGIGDEASGLAGSVHSQFGTWAKRRLWIGNCNPSQDFFFRNTEAGDLPDPENPGRFFRKVIRIRGHDSPNVRLALMQQAAGLKPTGEVIVPGVLPWDEYRKRMATWDKVNICVGIDAQFWKGSSLLLFPPDWLNHSESLALQLRGQKRQAKAIGIDPAEGGDKTAMAAIDEYGLVELVSKQTPDTSVITGEALAFMRKHNVPPDKV